MAYARFVLDPSTEAACTVIPWQPITPELDPSEVRDELLKQAAAVSSGDLSRLEAMLTGQAHTLDALFNHLAQRAQLSMGKYQDAFERYLRLALKAQSQCRATIEGLAEIKNPKSVAFVQQANIAAGHQQVNIGGVSRPVHTGAPARAGNPNQSNELMEDKSHGNGLECGTAGAGIAGHTPMEAVGEVDRAKVTARKSKGRRKQS